MRIAAPSHQPVITGLVILGLLASPSWQHVTIELRNGSRSLGDEYKYKDNSVFTNHFTNIPSVDDSWKGELKGGYIWMWDTFPMNGCQYIDPLPYASPYADNNGSRYRWFALIEGLRRCPDDMVQNVRNAGFELVIGYNNGSSSPPDLFKSLRDSDFPMVSVTSDYAERLWEVATTNSSLDGSVTVDVSVEHWKYRVIGLILLFIFTLPFCCLFFGFFIWWYRIRRRLNIPRPQNSRVSANTPVVELQLDTHTDDAPADPQDFLALPDLHEFDVPVDMDELDVLAMIGFQMELLHNEHEPSRRPEPLENEEVDFLQKLYAHVRPDEFTFDESCRICLEEYEETEMVSILPCKHYFHPKCIEKWVKERWGTCPICNQAVIGQK